MAEKRILAHRMLSKLTGSLLCHNRDCSSRDCNKTLFLKSDKKTETGAFKCIQTSVTLFKMVENENTMMSQKHFLCIFVFNANRMSVLPRRDLDHKMNGGSTLIQMEVPRTDY